MLKQPKKHDCSCSGHRRGHPKVSFGPCYGMGAMRPATKARIRGKRSALEWLRALSPDDEDL